MSDLSIYENYFFQTFRVNVSANCRKCSQDTNKIPKVLSYQEIHPSLFLIEFNSVLLLFRYNLVSTFNITSVLHKSLQTACYNCSQIYSTTAERNHIGFKTLKRYQYFTNKTLKRATIRIIFIGKYINQNLFIRRKNLIFEVFFNENLKIYSIK